MIYIPGGPQIYWFVAGDQTQVWSSADDKFVPITNAAYLDWVSQGGTPTNIDSLVNLAEVLRSYGVTTTNTTMLDTQKTNTAAAISTHSELKILFNHENRIRACERYCKLNGSPVAITAQQWIAAIKAML